MKRLLVLLLGAIGVLATLAACGSDPTATPTSSGPAATATPTPTAKPTPTTAPGQTPQPTATPTPRSRYELTLFVGGQGSSSYALGVGTGEIVNKNHPWLRLRIVETQGPEGILTYANEPDKRPFMINSFSQLDIGTFLNGASPLDKPIEPMLALFLQSPNSSVGTICADPNIRTLNDLAGKRVALGVPGNGTYNGVKALAEQIGVWDKINYQTIASSTQQSAAYIDGRIDCTSIGIIDQWTTSSAAQPMQTRGAYTVNHGDAALFKAAAGTAKLPLEPNAVCPGAFREPLKLNYEPTRGLKTNYIAFTPGYAAPPQVPEDVIYELVKTAWNNREEYRNFHVNGRFMADGLMANLVLDQKFFHPGAARFYKEISVPYGVAGHEAYLAKIKSEGKPNATC
ncbi:MAG: hypothetical protein FJ318_09005 [SAR202 cluster bacterium]|nr:hypothetical protein [SAR202 cluster bacterium]